MNSQPQLPRYIVLFTSLVLISLVFCTTSCKKLKDEPTEPGGGNGTGIFDGNSDVKPNIIFILADDVGYEVPAYTGGQSYSTPNLDLMALGGTQFTQGHASPLCSPSRFMLMTGKYNYRNYFRWGVLGTGERTLGNLAKEAGYVTCASGKWQFGGGDQAIHNFGFDSYAVNEAFNSADGTESNNDFYKDPTVYQNGQYLPDSFTNGKYGPDIFRDYVFNFIDSNKNKPFFVYWAMNLCHKPFSPTPDDADYTGWAAGQKAQPADTVYFPSMVRYMDKHIGQLMAKLREMQLDKNTLIIFSGDNGTPGDIFSKWNGQVIQGGKSEILERGYHVPLVAYLPGSVPAGRTDSSLIDYTDFITTFADLFKTSVPASYGTVDGVSFYPQLAGQRNRKSRDWVFCDFLANPEKPSAKAPRRWMQNRTYKEYDTIQDFFKSRRLYNIVDDPEENDVIPPKDRSDEVQKLYSHFRKTMATMH